jgi:hypothetical protein
MVPHVMNKPQRKHKDHRHMSEKPRTRTLMEIEQEVLAEGREWMRQRLEEKLQEEAAREGRVFPPQPAKGQAPAHGVDVDSDRGRGN